MTTSGTIVRSVEVAVDPATAFDIFTKEIDAWYVRLPYSWNDPERAVGIRFEPRQGGRWLEVWDEASGEGYEMGRVLAWEPGSRLLLDYRSIHLPPEPLTQIEVLFQATPGGTRVTLEHRGWERLPPDTFRAWASRAWIPFLKAFAAHAKASVEFGAAQTS